MIDAARYQRAKAIFFDACERTGPEREAFINQACADDASLRQAVLDLLTHDADPMSLHDSSRWRAHLEELADSSESAASGSPRHDDPASSEHFEQNIGGYRILRVLGKGGMGVVYLAEQDNPRRQVALKVLAPGPISPAILRRFKLEAQVLGRLHHPGIAQIFEAGTYDAGRGSQPYFAMELVHGRPLLAYCNGAELDRHTRLELFTAVCEAVEHAHQHGVIHRDLKPANIMVDETSSPPQPKILDFGVARATAGDLSLTSMHTRADQIIGTVAYMSPEQLGGKVDDLDRRADVYSLGIILFELLTGRLPHDLDGKTMPETIRIVGQEEPTMLATISRSYRGDLDTIVGKALERDRSRRYATAGELADDLRRHLADEPILARPPSRAYVLRKFARRNKALVAGLAAVFVALVAGLATTTWQARKAIRARDEQIGLRKKADDAADLAQREAAKAVAANGFVRRMLSSVQPEIAQGRDVTVREVLDSAALEIRSGSLREQRDVEALVNLIIGDAYRGISRYDEAHFHLEQSLEQARALYGEPSAEVAAVLLALGYVHHDEERQGESIRVVEQALDMLHVVHDGDHDDIALAMNNLALYLYNAGQQDAGQAKQREAIDMLIRLHGEDNMDVADTRAQLAGMLHDGNEAERLYRRAIDSYLATVGRRHPSYVQALRGLAGALLISRRTDEAAHAYLEALDAARGVYGDQHNTLILIMSDLMFCHQFAKNNEKALAVADDVVAMSEAVWGRDSLATVDVRVDRGDILAVLNRLDESLAEFEAVAAIGDRLNQHADKNVCLATLSIAAILLKQERDQARAEALCRTILAMPETDTPDRRWTRGWATSMLGEAARQRGDFPAAETLLIEAYDLIGDSSIKRAHRITAVNRLLKVYEQWTAAEPDVDRTTETAKWKTVLADLTAPSKPAVF